jgi:cellulose synthase/poly-beta-1,6-N-acetylglucosamine synthase-like glycosyltransferase
VVVADNCTDDTAALARAGGALVLERQDATRRGKGYALAWAFERLLGPDSPLEQEGAAGAIAAFAIVDADTEVAPDFLSRMAARLPSSPLTEPLALQGYYGVQNPEGGWRAALMEAAFDLVNHVRPLGAERLGLYVGLKGNGMVFTRALLRAAPWSGSSITEDIDYGLDLLLHHGWRVRYVPEARVRAQMPVGGQGATTQRERWERGRYQLLRARVPGLIAQGLRRFDRRLLSAALDLLTPPLAELCVLLALWAAAAGIGWRLGALGIGWLIGCGAALIGLGLYLLGGLKASGASPLAYKALLRAPFYIVWKLALYALRLTRRGDNEWVRTARLPTGGTDSAP